MVILARNEVKRTQIISVVAIILGLATLVGLVRADGGPTGVSIALGLIALAGIVLAVIHILSGRGPSKIILFHQGNHTVLATNHLHQANRLRFFRDILSDHSVAFSDEERERWSTLAKEGFYPVFNVRELRKPYLLALCFMTFDEVYVLDHLGRWDYFDCHNTSEPTYSSRGVSPFRDDSILPTTEKQPA